MTERTAEAQMTERLIQSATDKPDVLTWWGDDLLECQYLRLASWAKHLMRGDILGLWGDDWLAEAQQMFKVCHKVSYEAQKHGKEPPYFPAPEYNAAGLCKTIIVYFGALSEGGLDPVVFWSRQMTALPQSARAQLLSNWIKGAASGKLLGYWGHKPQHEIAAISAVVNVFLAEMAAKGFQVPMMPRQAADLAGYVNSAGEFLNKVAPHLTLDLPDFEMAKAEAFGCQA